MTEAPRTALSKNAQLVRAAVEIAEALTALGRPASERELRTIVHAHRMQLREALDAAIGAGLVEFMPMRDRSTLFRPKRALPGRPQAAANP